MPNQATAEVLEDEDLQAAEETEELDDLESIARKAVESSDEDQDDGADEEQSEGEEGERAVAETREQAEEAQAPQDWPQHHRDAFNGLAKLGEEGRKAQGVLMETYQNMVRGFHGRMQQISEFEQGYKSLAQMVEPRLAFYQQHNMNPNEAVATALSYFDAFLQDPITTTAKLIAETGQVEKIFQAVSQFQGQQGEQNQVLDKLGALEKRLNEDQQQAAIRERQQQYVQLFNRFEAAQTEDGKPMYPLFREALPTIRDLMQRGLVKPNDFQNGYVMAFRVNEQLSQALRQWMAGQQASGTGGKPSKGPSKPTSERRTTRRVSGRSNAPQPVDDEENDLDAIARAAIEESADD